MTALDRNRAIVHRIKLFPRRTTASTLARLASHGGSNPSVETNSDEWGRVKIPKLKRTGFRSRTKKSELLWIARACGVAL